MRKKESITNILRVLLLLAAGCVLLCGEECSAREKLKKVYSDSKGINSWWVYPLSVTDGEKTYTSYTSKEGLSGIIMRDNKTKTVSRVNLINVKEVDDHNAGAVELLADGRILYAVTGHASTKCVVVFTSEKAGDITKWKKHKIRADGKCTYVQVIKNSRGYFLFTRIMYTPQKKLEDGNKIKWAWAVSYSKNGTEWSALKNVVHGYREQYYVKAMAVKGSSLIRLVTYSIPNGKINVNANNIRLCFYNPVTENVEDADGHSLYPVTEDGYGLAYDQYGIIVENEDKALRLLDVAYTNKESTVLVYAILTENGGQYRYLNYNSKNLTSVTKPICESGAPFFRKSNYVGGVVLSEKDPKILYLSREENGVWYIEKWQYQRKKFRRVKIICQSSEKVKIRPFLDKYGGCYLQWSSGRYDAEEYTQFDTVICRAKVQ